MYPRDNKTFLHTYKLPMQSPCWFNQMWRPEGHHLAIHHRQACLFLKNSSTSDLVMLTTLTRLITLKYRTIKITNFVKRSDIFVPKYYFQFRSYMLPYAGTNPSPFEQRQLDSLEVNPTFSRQINGLYNYWRQNEFIFYSWFHEFNFNTHDADTAFMWWLKKNHIISGMLSDNRGFASLQRFGDVTSFSLSNDRAFFMWQGGLVWCSLNMSYIAFSSRWRLFLSGLILRHRTYVNVTLLKPLGIMGSNSYRHIE